MILDTLWPDYAPGKSLKQLYNGIYYIRKILSENGVGNRIVIDKADNLKLNDVDFDLDTQKNAARL
jgi:DNA-binding transcriptional activator of the SARP family